MRRSPTRLAVHPLFLLERVWERSLCQPFVVVLQRLGVRPNAVTAAAFTIKISTLPLMFGGRYSWAGAVWILGAVSDALDGTLARRLGAETRLGAFLDATGDRVAAAALVAAFSLGVGTVPAYQAGLALVTASLLLALTRAKAESLGVRSGVRALHRSGRSIWVSSALILGPSMAVAAGRPPAFALIVAFWILTAVTSVAIGLVVVRTVRELA